MKIQDTFKLQGALTLMLTKADGTVEVTQKDNIIVDVGFDFIANAIGNAASRPSCMGYTAVGTGTTAAATSQTSLGTEVSRLASTYAHTAGTKTFTFTTTFAAGVATGAITESGVFNAASAGIMIDRVVFPVVNKGADDTLTTVFTFTMS